MYAEFKQAALQLLIAGNWFEILQSPLHPLVLRLCCANEPSHSILCSYGNLQSLNACSATRQGAEHSIALYTPLHAHVLHVQRVG